ncbi:uncharacterized protein PV09_07440 [Verruconis gallopava]|uniref:Rab-GAP TBC domain-containing protein n=1 Tax=Verruconis gallopava TaxID=253628 RepID=A0A0D2APR8_9PEZI|nr:uncharacterized protein PV09_07440 [Verruconis gallopava]KIW01154.1 hypothetical protein PV09_07440 [Verruconis gallopava]
MRPAAEVNQYQQLLLAYSNFAEFQAAVLDSDQHLDILEGLRSVCWKIFLLFRNLDQAQWLSSLTKSRSAYDALRTHYLRAIENPDEVDTADDPLVENTESPWTTLRQDEAIRQEIFQDIERCMPENTYFRQPETQSLMLDILFVYTKLNRDVGYRQGMHELLAFILWTVERDAVKVDEQEQMLHQVLDARYVEHDSFTLFVEIMRTAKSFYDPAGVGTQEFLRSGVNHVENESAMLQKSSHIFMTLLPQYDPGLAAHLMEVDISPQLFLMRWVRLLFGREFLFNDTLRVWDLLFADDPNLELIDYICIAMILRIRWNLIDADTNDALMLLMRYPPTSPEHPPRSFVLDARYLRSTPSVEAGSDIIKKYSKRAPLPFKPRPQRPSTPDHTNISPGTPRSQRSRSPFVPTGLPNAFDTLINDAARGFMNRGEKWGFNQAVRDAVGEVRKNVQNLQVTSRGSPRGSSLMSPGHRSNKSSTETAGNIAANVLRKLTTLERRNKELAQMLEVAVADLWSAEKEIADGKGVREEALQKLSMAIAKVQFVQVFLQDSTLPLPEEEISRKTETAATKEAEITSGDTAKVQEEMPNLENQQKDSGLERMTSSLAPSPLPAATRPMATSSPPPSLPTTSISTHHVSATSPSIAKASLDPSPAARAYPNHATSRARIEQSSYSWILSQEDSSDSTRPSFAPPEKKYHVQRKEKGFLFGEDNDVVGERRVVKGRAVRKVSRDVRKIGASSSPAPLGRVIDNEDTGIVVEKSEEGSDNTGPI